MQDKELTPRQIRERAKYKAEKDQATKKLQRRPVSVRDSLRKATGVSTRDFLRKQAGWPALKRVDPN